MLDIITDIMEEMGFYLALLSEANFFHNSSHYYNSVTNVLINTGL